MIESRFIVELKAPTNPANLSKYYARVSELVKLAGRVSIASKPSEVGISGFDTGLNSASYLLEQVPSIDILFHLTCYDLNKVNIKARLTSLKQLGIRRILVITGDDYAKPSHGSKWCDLFYENSSQLLDDILEHYKWFQTIAVGGYPGGDGRRSHNDEQECLRLARSLTHGANAVYSQCIFNPELFRDFEQRLKSDFPNIEVIPSVALFKNTDDLERVTKLTRARGTSCDKLISELDRLKDPNEAQMFTVRFLVGLCKTLLDNRCTIDLCTFGQFDLAKDLIARLIN